jgi:hypothetical protein
MNVGGVEYCHRNVVVHRLGEEAVCVDTAIVLEHQQTEF